MDRLTLLSTFARIADRGSISAAARDLGLSQASVSRQLARLETLLGVPLIIRTTHDLSLTETGRDALARARGLIADWEALRDAVHEDPEAPLSGRLRVVVPVALGQTVLTRTLLSFLGDHPGLDLTWQLSDAEQRMAEAGLDLWVRIGQPQDDTLIVRTAGTVERLLVGAAPQAVASPDQFDGPLVAMSLFEGNRVTLWDEGGRPSELRADVRLRVNDIFALREAALSGAGAAVLPRWMIEADLAEGRLHDLLPGWRAERLPVTLCHLPAQRHSRRMIAVRDLMEDTIAAMPGIRSG